MAYDIFNRKHEIIIAGGGLMGFAAAMTAARAGRKVVLTNRRPALGWEITTAFQTNLKPQGLAGEILDRLSRISAAKDNQVSPPAVELLLDEMCNEAGVELLLYATPIAAAKSDSRVRGLIVGSKQGRDLLQADLTVDATDHATLADHAGLDVRHNTRTPAQGTIILNGCENLDNDPVHLGDIDDIANITVTLSIWPGEIIVRYDIPDDSPNTMYLAVPKVLTLLRQQLPAAKDAFVSSLGIEPCNLSPRYTLDPDTSQSIPGLLATNPPADATITDLIIAGEALGRQAVTAWQDLSRSDPPTVDTDLASQGLLLDATSHETSGVLVAGGGTAGAIAAIAAARSGARTRLIEPLTYLGGIGSGGGIHWYYHGVAGGIQDDVDARVDELQPLFVGKHKMFGFNPEAKKIALLQLALEAGVELSFATTAIEVTTETLQPADQAKTLAKPGESAAKPPVKITSIIAADDHGLKVYEASAFIDSTGDGDIAAKAGAPFALGREGDGQSHAYSQPAGLFRPVKEDEPDRMFIRHANFDAGFVDPDDVTDLTRARQLGLEHLRLEKWTHDKRWTYIAPHIGLRQSRQILGDYQLTLADQIAGRTFDDVIAYAVSHYDNHASDYENESDAAVVWVWLLGQWHTRYGCEIPYRCLLPRNVEGLLVACRALSITQDAHHQLRMQRDMQRLGEAAGFAAALAVKTNTTPRSIDIKQLQSQLTNLGSLDEKLRPAPALEAMSNESLVNTFSGEKPPVALWQVAGGDEKALALLRKSLESTDANTRYWAASALALSKDTAAVPELLSVLKERRDEQPEGVKQAPKWYSSLILLGRIADPAAADEIENVLTDPDSPINMVVAAIRALGRIGDASKADAIYKTLARTDLQIERKLQNSISGKEVVDNTRWQIDLAAAQALHAMGKSDRTIVEPYLTDPRAYVRRAVKTLFSEIDQG